MNLPRVVKLVCLECGYEAHARSVDAAREAWLDHRTFVGHGDWWQRAARALARRDEGIGEATHGR